MGWLYVPGLEGSTSESPSPRLTIAPSVTWRGKPSPLRLWLRRWKTASWLQRLSGMTCLPSTLDRGVESWIASLRASRVSHTRLPVSSEGTATNGPYGQSSSESSKSVPPPWSFSKTSQTLFTFSGQLEKNYREWATGLRLEYSARRKLARPIGGKDSSCWPTASAHDGKPGSDSTSTQHANLKRDAENWATNSPLGHQAPQSMNAGQESHEASGQQQLNPRFVEWLMGFPLGWTAFERSAMASYLCRQRMLLRHLQEKVAKPDEG
jgi:hypothetical protein